MSGPVMQRGFHLEGLGRETGRKMKAGTEVKVHSFGGSEMLGSGSRVSDGCGMVPFLSWHLTLVYQACSVP